MGGNVGNMNPAGQPLTTAAGSTSGSSSAPQPAAKQRLETGTVSLEFLPGEVGGVNHTIAYLCLLHPVHRACEFLHTQRQVLVQVELLVLLKNKKQNPQYMYMQLDKDI